MNSKPLEGFRVVDLCVVWAGPFATLQLADLGAEVIKAENPHVWQPMTRGGAARPPAPLLAAQPAWAGGYPDSDPGDRPWDYSPTFVSLFRNKKSFTVDLRKPEGMDVLGRLVAVSDVVYENNATGTLEKLGITYEWLRRTNPTIIYVRVPAYGSTGPYFDARALGVHLEGVMGHSLLRGYEDADPSSNTSIFSGDYMAGCQGAFAVMAALWHREKTGEGQLIEIGQAENASAMFTQAIMDYSLNGRVQTTIGNRDLDGRHPSGVYPCLSAGTAEECLDRWIAISVETDAQWESLVAIMGSPDWAQDPRFGTNGGRLAAHKELDQLIASFTRDKDDYELMHAFQAAGVAAAPVLEVSRSFDDPQFKARGFYRPLTQPSSGTYQYSGPMWNLPETPVEFTQAPAMFGEHNDYVYSEVLGMSSSEIATLKAAGHIATVFDEDIP
ncbi:MAG TPA: CoA transferase [Dehalococcoidia bacterium]|nr:CoA transferase [Dehalococcoidia bacterium]